MADLVAVLTGGRDHFPTLAELKFMVAEGRRRGVTRWRHGNAQGLDRTAGGYLNARGFVVESWPADWTTHKRAAGAIRNRAMLDGDPPDLLGKRERIPAGLLFAFRGGKGTADCRQAAKDRGIETVAVHPRREPRIWNMYHRWSTTAEQPPGLVYVGRSRRWGGPSPLANPYRVEFLPGEDRAAAAPRILGMYRRWLWGKMQAGDQAVLAALDAITPDTFLGCTCWPAHCHAEVIVRAWRYRQETNR